MDLVSGIHKICSACQVKTFHLLLFTGILCWAGSVLSAPQIQYPESATTLPVRPGIFLGDFESMKKRRLVRVAVPYSRSLFFNDRGEQRGLTAEVLREFERWINRGQRKGDIPILVVAVPTTRDRLLPMLLEGKVDIAAGNLTITPERDQKVDFSVPLAIDIEEVVVSGPSSARIEDLDDLSGKTVYVRPSSSYYQSLLRINNRFRDHNKAEIVLKAMPEALEDEDLMEMVGAGIIGLIVVDNWKARLWASILPNLVVRDDIHLAEGGQIGWAFRENSPQLAATINEFVRKKNFAISAASRLAEYQRRLKLLKNPTAEADWQRFENSISFFKKYGERYRFDHLMVVAQGYQESRLDQKARSPSGAIGIMQLMPETGYSLRVGDIHQAEPNVHGGIKYMRQLYDRYLSNADFDELNRTLFAFAAYNAGPGRIARLRKEAAKLGLNPNIWFNNVELVAAHRIGQETVGYIRNIYKYYVAFKLQLETLEERRRALDIAK